MLRIVCEVNLAALAWIHFYLICEDTAPRYYWLMIGYGRTN